MLEKITLFGEEAGETDAVSDLEQVTTGGLRLRETSKRRAGSIQTVRRTPRMSPSAASPSNTKASRTAEIRIGISSCLLGEEVRFDGGHKRDRFLTDTLTDFVSFVPVCPEMEIGLGTPRETMHLEKVGKSVRLLTTKSREDLTDRMVTWAEKRVAQLEAMDLCGFILKKGSPSCGMERVKVYGRGGTPPSKQGRGLFAAELLDRITALPVEEEGRLHDPRLRENFFVRVFAYRRLKSFFETDWKQRDLIAFHTAEKLLLRAHDPEGFKKLGQLVAAGRRRSPRLLQEEYSTGVMDVLRKKATVRKVAAVLQHTLGHLRKHLDDRSRHELLDLIEDFRSGLIPSVVPMTLLAHHARHHEIEYLLGQTFLDPHPKELMLRNHV